MNTISVRLNIIIFIVWCCFFAIGATTIPSFAQQTMRPQTVRIVMDNNYPPYVFYDSSGNLQGILIDQWRLWEKKTGVRTDIIALDWNNALRRMEKGEFEVIDTIFLTEKRARLYDFSKPYADINVSIFFHKNISGIVDVNSIKGFAVAVKSGDAAVDFLRMKGVTQLLEFSSYEAIIKAVQEKKITVFVMDKPPALYFLYKAGLQDEFVFSEPLYKGQFHRAVTKGYAKTLNLVEEGFSRISADEYKAIDRKWLGSHFTFPAFLTYMAYTAVMLACVGLVLGILNYTLRKKVRERTCELRESERRLSDIIEFLPDATLVVDPEGKVIAWNRAIEALTGVKAGEMLGKGSYEYAIPFYGEKRPILIDIALKWDPEQVTNYTAIRKIGDSLFGEAFTPNLPLGRRHLSATASVLRNADGEITAAIECIRDNTERKELEDRLIRSEREYRHLVDNTPGGVFRTHRDGRILFANQEFANILHYDSLEELMACNAAQLYKYAESRKLFLDAIEKSGTVKNYEIELVTKDSLTRDIMLSAVMEGDIITGTLADITERKWAHDELKRYSEEISDLYAHAPCGYHSLDADGTFMRINGTELNWLGYNRDELIGRKKFGDLMTPESREAFKINYPLFKERGWIKDAEYQLIRRDGTILPVILNATAIKDSEGNFLQSRASLFDNMDRKKIEEERKGLEERLQRSEKMESLGMLAGGVAHDLNNVLGILIGYSELIDVEIDESSPIRPHVKYLRQGGERAAAIVQDLLTLARRGVQAREVVNLNEIVTDTEKSPELENLLSFHPGVRLKTKLDADLLNIKGSTVHLSKTLMNLISNAAEAMKAGGLLTVASCNEYLDRPVHGYDAVREGDYVVLTVSDTGEGISSSDMKRIFEPFYTKKVMGRSGTGLGLAVVWGTVKDHNGYINVESEEGKGTTFTLYFPVTREDISGEQTPTSVAEYLGNGESALIVDDVEGQRELAGRMLKKLNYEVVTVSCGEEAVEYLRKNKVDIVVLDMIMDPGMDGLDTYKKILELHPKQKAIIVSGFSESDRVRQAQELGAGTYVKKPYVHERLGIAVRKELNKLM